MPSSFGGHSQRLGVSPVIAKTPLACELPDQCARCRGIPRRDTAALKNRCRWPASVSLSPECALVLAVMGMIWRKSPPPADAGGAHPANHALVALTPMIVLLFGRGIAATLVVTVIVTFFPAFITIAQAWQRCRGHRWISWMSTAQPAAEAAHGQPADELAVSVRRRPAGGAGLAPRRDDLPSGWPRNMVWEIF